MFTSAVPQPEVDQVDRSESTSLVERHIRAGAVWDLVLAGILTHRETELSRYARAVGCSQEDILVHRRQRPFGRAQQNKSRKAAERRTTTGPDGLRRCGLCEKEKPLEAFSFKQPRLNVRRSYCDPCYRAYQRGRYESDAKRQAMVAAGVRFAVRHDGGVELTCTGCDTAIKQGDRMIVQGNAWHARCAP